jgi:transcriptional regulator with XRE-family HTH domain
MQSTSELAVAFGRRLREVRQRQDLTQEQLADRTGMRPGAVGRLERGGRCPALATTLRLACGLCVPPGTLLDPLARLV